jgi:hypothetical protein
MRKIATLFALLTALVCLLPTAPAQAQAARTFVSAAGSDSNNCTNVSTPCRHLAAAYAKTSANGEIDVLDPANYGALTITGPVSIEGHGWASITPAFNGNAVTINAQPSDKVILRGLIMDGARGASTTGIQFNSGASLIVEDCVVRNMTGDGFEFNFVVNAATNAQTLEVSDSSFNNNGGFGIHIQTINAPVIASLNRTEIVGNGDDGLNVSTGILPLTVAVRDSVSANNSFGFTAHSVDGGPISLTLTHSEAVGNVFGVSALGNAVVWLAQSTLTGNTGGIQVTSPAIINSFGDNYITDTYNVGTLTGVSKQ